MNTETAFQPNEHLINLGTQRVPRWYLPVQWRLVWLRELCPEAQISTEVVHLDLDKGVAIFKATVKYKDAIAVGHGSETIKDFKDFIEKAETKSIGRALAALGFGTQFAPELDEGPRIADAPVEQAKPQPRQSQPHAEQNAEASQPSNVQPMKPRSATPTKQSDDGQINKGQINCLLTLYGKLDQTPPSDLPQWSFAQARQAIVTLQSELKQAS